MNTQSLLIVDDQTESLFVIRKAVQEAAVQAHYCSETETAKGVLRNRGPFTVVIARMTGKAIDGLELLRTIRISASPAELPVLLIMSDSDLEHAVTAIDSGANDLLMTPFRAQEFSIRTGIRSRVTKRRIDATHPTAQASPEPPRIRCEMPRIDPNTFRFSYGVTSDVLNSWSRDEQVTSTHLDTVLVCPECGGIPTFRHGCEACGSAMTEPESIIHHYACAHIGAESTFRKGSILSCPKCLQSDLVAGSDFECVSGAYRCHDCNHVANDPVLIGHCLSCQCRFPASEAITYPIVGYHVPASKTGTKTELDRLFESIQHTSRPLRRNRRKSSIPAGAGPADS